MGERYAVRLLEEKGYRVLERNFHSRYGEVDLIISDGQYICFVEVKTRRQGSMVGGFTAVTMSKQRKIIATALLYLQQNPSDLQPRFDVLSILVGKPGEVLAHDYLTGAFDCEAYYR